MVIGEVLCIHLRTESNYASSFPQNNSFAALTCHLHLNPVGDASFLFNQRGSPWQTQFPRETAERRQRVSVNGKCSKRKHLKTRIRSTETLAKGYITVVRHVMGCNSWLVPLGHNTYYTSRTGPKLGYNKFRFLRLSCWWMHILALWY